MTRLAGLCALIAACPVLYVAGVVALDFGAMAGASGFVISAGLWVVGVAAIGGGR